ncbi:hypothetical protein HY419_00090 [candidate division WWE3 bacterium]|nr:hypothetical protein [candidate division WWE3 bacterium]
MNSVQIIPGILENSLEKIKEKVRRLEKLEPLLHLDVADGKFVPNTTFDKVNELSAIASESFFELHLMVRNPSGFIPKDNSRISKIICHFESEGFSRDLLKNIRAARFVVGIAVNPETKIYSIGPFLEYADCVQFMTVHPGFSSQGFLNEVVENIRDFHKNYPEIPIQVDGGINPQTIGNVLEAGATLVVSTSYLDHCADLKKCITSLERSKL